MSMVFKDVFGQPVMAGENYAVGRGTRIAKGVSTNQMTLRVDEDGQWYGQPRNGGDAIRLGIPGEQDAAGEQANLAFQPLDFNWEPIEEPDGDLDYNHRKLRLILDNVYERTQKRAEQVELDVRSLLDMSEEELTECERNAVWSYVTDGLGRDVVEEILLRNPANFEPAGV